MYYVYILESKKDKMLYTGCTNDLKARLVLHNSGKVISTKDRRPFSLIFYECFQNKYDAYEREKWFKSGYGRIHVKNMLKNYLNPKK